MFLCRKPEIPLPGILSNEGTPSVLIQKRREALKRMAATPQLEGGQLSRCLKCEAPSRHAGKHRRRQAFFWVTRLAETPHFVAPRAGKILMVIRNLKTINRTRARYALQWRPKFLAALALGRSMVFAAKAAKVAYMTPRNHRLLDPDFNRQCEEAIDYATELLEARAFQRALEGDCEPIVYMGVVVGHVKKFDSRLQIELLRAYRPERFKTPGTQVNIAAKNDVFVLTEEQRHELMRINREWLLTAPLPDGSPAPSHCATLQPQALTNGEAPEPTP